MATPLTLIQLRCPTCSETMWVMDHVVRGMALLGGGEKPFPARNYICRHCRYHGSGYTFLQKAPSGFLLQPHPMYPMGRKAFRFWLEILKEHFPDYYRLRATSDRFYPNLPSLHQQLAGALSVMSFLLESRKERRRYGNQAFKMDRICLTVLFEHHLRRIFDLPPAHSDQRLVDHIEGENVQILDDYTARRLVLAVFAEARKVVKHRPTFEQWRDDPYFAIGLDAYHRFGHQSVFPPFPDPDDWGYISTRELAPDDQEHTRLWWPVEDIL